MAIDWREKWRSWRLGLLLAAITFLAYQPAVWRGGFIWDDDVYVTNNKLLTAPDGLRRIWFSLDSPSQYFPLVYTVLRVEHRLWGLAPRGYHWVNLLLHTANVLLLWRLLRRMGLPACWLAAALFALHPVEVESVAWVTELKNVLSLFFCLLSARAWVEFVNETPGRWWFYGAAWLCQALALTAKTTACTLPAALLLILWIQHKPIRLARCAPLAPFLAISLAMGLVTIWWERYHQFTVGSAFSISLAGRLLIASRAIWFYLGKLFWPVGLAFSYPRWHIDPGNPLAWGWLAACAAAAAAICLTRDKLGRGPETAALYFVATLSPLLGFIMEYTFHYTYVADHYQYAASIGPLTLAAAGMDKLFGRLAALKPVLYTALLTLLGLLTARQCEVYADSETLWRATLQCDPDSYIARNNLSQIYLKQGRLDDAIRLSREALALEPTDPVGELNLGYGLLQKGQWDESIIHCRRSLALQPNGPDAYYNIGQAFLKKGQFENARTNFAMAVRLKPDFAGAWCNLGFALVQNGRIDEAIASYQKALALDPDYALAHNDLGGILLRKGENAQALAHFQRAMELEPGFAEAHYNAGGVLFGMGRLEEALHQYEIAASLNPRFKQAHFMLGKVAEAFARHGDASRAASIAQEALRLAQAAGEADLESRFAAELRSYQQPAQKK